jgi:hypothetical protein
MDRMKTVWMASCVSAAMALIGCGEGNSEGETTSQSSTSPTWLLVSAPEDARSVVEAKSQATEGETIVLRGRIGGRALPMSDDSPVFTVMDLSIPHCGETAHDSCPAPWDYCCETPETIAAHSATVQVVGDDGRPITQSLTASGLSPLDEVIVVGTVGARPNERVLTVKATGVYRAES